MIALIPRNTQQWLAPYGFALVGLLLLVVVAHLVLRYLQNRYDFLWYRQWLSWRKVPLSRKRILDSFPFYQKLDTKQRKVFEHRTACFLAEKNFKHRYGKPVTVDQSTTIACVAVMLTFGRRNYMMEYLENILLFDEPFESASNTQKHKGEYNPKAKVLALSWPDVVQGIIVGDDNFHLALHEFTHLVHLESERAQHMDALRFHKYHQLMLLKLTDAGIRERMAKSRFFRDYAFTNQYEFMAVVTEYFFESTNELKSQFPELFDAMKKALLFKEEWL